MYDIDIELLVNEFVACLSLVQLALQVKGVKNCLHMNPIVECAFFPLQLCKVVK